MRNRGCLKVLNDTKLILNHIPIHNLQKTSPIPKTSFLPWTSFAASYFIDIFQNEICCLQRTNKWNKNVSWKIKIYCSQPWIRYAIYQCDWILGATYVSMCGWLGRGGFSPVFSKLPPTGTELLIHLLCPQHHGRLWLILSKKS